MVKQIKERVKCKICKTFFTPLFKKEKESKICFVCDSIANTKIKDCKPSDDEIEPYKILKGGNRKLKVRKNLIERSNTKKKHGKPKR